MVDLPVEVEHATINEGEDIETGRFNAIMEAMTSLYQETQGMRRDLAELKDYVVELENKAQAMASPEAMQEMMSKFMGGLG